MTRNVVAYARTKRQPLTDAPRRAGGGTLRVPARTSGAGCFGVAAVDMATMVARRGRGAAALDRHPGRACPSAMRSFLLAVALLVSCGGGGRTVQAPAAPASSAASEAPSPARPAPPAPWDTAWEPVESFQGA